MSAIVSMAERAPITRDEMLAAYDRLQRINDVTVSDDELKDLETIVLASEDLGVVNITYSIVSKRAQKADPDLHYATDVRHVSRFQESAGHIVIRLAREIRKLRAGGAS